MTHQWQEFFNHHAALYLQNEFTYNTREEIAFLFEELKLEKGQSILDIGCGVGRHSIELAKRGLHVTGVDISEGMLAEAQKGALAAGIEVEWIHSDATQFHAKRQYDAVICLCEGAFSLLSAADDPIEHDLAILRNVYAALKPQGRFLLTALSALRFIRMYNQTDIATGKFDPMSMTEHSEMEYTTPEGVKKVSVRERGYVPTELTLLFQTVGFTVEQVWGGTAGAWKRQVLDPDEYEIMVVACKP